MHDAKLRGDPEVEVWGSGNPRREFLHVDDLADACVHALKRYSDEIPLNIGTGLDVTIKQLAELIRQIVGFEGELRFNRTKPDGTPRKLLDISKLQDLGWRPTVDLCEGIANTFA